MAETRQGSVDHQELVAVIREVRSRWRTKVMLRGAFIVFGGALLAVILASLGLQVLRFSQVSVITFRILVFGVSGVLAFLWFVRPMRRRITDMEVALYVEEHDPKLQAAMLTAVEVGAAHPSGPAEQSPVIDRLVEQAVEKCRSLEGGKVVGRQALKRHAVALTALAGTMALLLIVGPDFLRQGASALLVLEECGGGQPIRDCRDARECHRAEGFGAADYGHPGRVPLVGRLGHGQGRRRQRLHATRAHRHRRPQQV